MIPMRDGVKLFTAIYIPRDTIELHPILLSRTPYSCEPYGETSYPFNFGNSSFIKEKYIIVYQDVRGRYMSEGKFTEVTPHLPNKKGNETDESSDAYDTIDWLLKNIKGNNGRVGIHGISYPGFYATAALPNAHPALKAVSPQAPVTDEFEGDDVYHRGAFFLLDNVDFLNEFDYPRKGPLMNYPVLDSSLKIKDTYQFYLGLGPIRNVNHFYFKNRSQVWNEYISHDKKDAYWKARNIRPHLKNLKPAVLVVGGWFDAEDLFGTLKTYEAIEQQNPVNNNYLLVGPWTHGSWTRNNFSAYASYHFGGNTTGKFFEIEADFFRYYLKNMGSFNPPEANIFFTGANKWRSFSKWPAPGTTKFKLYFNKNGRLSSSAEKSYKGFEQYVSDPANPVPYTALRIGFRDQSYPGADQRFVSKRPDVLFFETETLNEPVTLAGPIITRLFASINDTDADFVVKVIDVYPDSLQQLVRAEVLRGKFRNSYTNPQPFVPGKITPLKLVLNDIAHEFKAGHKIMVQIQSSWFPLVDRNPHQFMTISEAEESDFKKATIKIHRNAKYPSSIEFQQLQIID
ncbi:MAG: CocE/NonD family hydrolase [Bacteroidota bacterium]